MWEPCALCAVVLREGGGDAVMYQEARLVGPEGRKAAVLGPGWVPWVILPGQWMGETSAAQEGVAGLCQLFQS